MSDAALQELLDALGADIVLTRPESVEAYRRDWTGDASAGMPLAVVRPWNAQQVQVTMRWASAHGIPVVPRGAGSGLSGGSLAVDGGITLSLDRMTAIVIDRDTRTAVVEPGALNAEVKRAAAADGLWYPPDPSSFEICSIGGNIATNAGGLCCVKYGVTTDYVLGLDVVLADGTWSRWAASGSRTSPGSRSSSSSSAARAPSASSPGRSCGSSRARSRRQPSWRPSTTSGRPLGPSCRSAPPSARRCSS